MNKDTITTTIINFIKTQIPIYTANPDDNCISNSNVAVCIIDEQGSTYGKMFGKDKIKQRYFYQIAWSKASQVWITHQPTGTYEQLVFNGEIDDKKFGIKRHDFIGWKGGELIEIDGCKLSIAFSGFRESSDVEIVSKAIKNLHL